MPLRIRPEDGNEAQTVKVVLLGESGVGKSSLALRFVTNEFKPYSEATIGASFMSKTVLVPPDNLQGEVQDDLEETPRKIAFKIWDTAGQEKYACLAPMYYRGAGAAVLVYDICKAASFETLKRWVQELRCNGPPNIVIAVCGNKYDLAEQYRQVDVDVARKYSESINATFYEASAKEAINVQVIFHDLARRLPDTSRDFDDVLEGESGGRIDLSSMAPPLQSNWLSWC